ncbi:hypothetical protein RYH80_15665 [Halobaculum sp. MBLA0147]|uniref:hypothetical protein n=1 Tax=Halobaculum sp. MBLA0147 TaxID=3079934 RepID=UPI003526C06F
MSSDGDELVVQLDPDTADAVGAYAEEHDLSEAAAVHHAVDDHLRRPTPDGGEVLERLDRTVDRLDRIEARQRRTEQLQFRYRVGLVGSIVLFVAFSLFDLPTVSVALAGAALSILVLEATLSQALAGLR